MARVALTLLICLCWAADSAAQPSVRARLVGSAQATRQLLKNDRTGGSGDHVEDGIDWNSELMPRRHPLKTDVTKYTQQRPWTRDYTVRYGDSLGLPLSNRQAARWPTPDDGPALRALLADHDASVRSLAVEALATLHDPEDLERIAALLNDHASGVPALGWESWRSAFGRPYEQSKYDLVRSWYARRVSSYARVALRLMTGRNFDTASFAAWHARQPAGRSAFWYWDIRLRQRLAEAWADRESARGYDERRATAAASIRAELRNEPAEVEAKVCLVSYERVLGPCDGLRVGRERLLELLERKNLWPDVGWGENDYLVGAPYSALVIEISRVSREYFTRDDVPRLMAVHERERVATPHVQNALKIGIAMLLPVADDNAIDRLDTLDGFLRDSFRSASYEEARRELAQELIRLNPPRHWPFLEPYFFADARPFKQSRLRTGLLDELRAAPLTSEKRSLLAAIVLDDRFAGLWTRPLGEMGDDGDRQSAKYAVNAHAGREVISVFDEQDLRTPETAARALAKVRETVRAALGVK